MMSEIVTMIMVLVKVVMVALTVHGIHVLEILVVFRFELCKL